MNDEARNEWEAWCSERRAYVTGVPGNLALVAYHSVTSQPTDVELLDGVQVWRDGDQVGVTLDVSNPVEYGGGPVGPGVFVVERTGPGAQNAVDLGRYWIDAFSLDGSDYELRIYDSEAPRLSEFERIETYDFDPAMIARGEFGEYDETDSVPWEFTRVTDTGHTKPVPGKISLVLGNEPIELLGFLDGPNLVLVFADGTTGKESYAPGRFLIVASPDGDGRVTLDFNRAFVPPCGFSDFYSCPIPPPGNRIVTPIRAGERRVLWAAGPS